MNWQTNTTYRITLVVSRQFIFWATDSQTEVAVVECRYFGITLIIIQGTILFTLWYCYGCNIKCLLSNVFSTFSHLTTTNCLIQDNIPVPKSQVQDQCPVSKSHISGEGYPTMWPIQWPKYATLLPRGQTRTCEYVKFFKLRLLAVKCTMKWQGIFSKWYHTVQPQGMPTNGKSSQMFIRPLKVYRYYTGCYHLLVGSGRNLRMIKYVII